MTDQRWRSLVAVAMAFVLAVLLAASGAGGAAANEPLTLEGDEVITYGLEPYELENSTRIIRQGERMPDGSCAFSAERSLQPGESIAEIEIAYDPATCRSLYEVGILVGGDQGLDGGADSDSATEGATTNPGSAGLSSAAAPIGTFAAFQWSWFDEPARWVRGCDVEDPCPPLPPVNTVRNGIEWSPDGTCAVAPGTIGWMDFRITWLVLTGWQVIRNDWAHSPDPIPCDQDIFSQNVNHFQNRAFCAALLGPPFLLFPTNTYYDINKVRGDENGTAFFSWQWRKDGPCSALLRFNQKHDNERIG
jgi:hypothetical protein